MNGDTIYHLQIGEEHHYFGSISAIYDMFEAEQIGISKTSLWTYGVRENRPYKNRKCVVRKGKLLRKKGNRNAGRNNR